LLAYLADKLKLFNIIFIEALYVGYHRPIMRFDLYTSYIPRRDREHDDALTIEGVGRDDREGIIRLIRVSNQFLVFD
jgi:hypothetical protein